MRKRQLALGLEVEDGDTSPKQSQKLDRIDVQMTEMQKILERKCQKILRPDLDFSDEVQF